MRVVYFSGSTCDHKFGISSFFHFTRQQAGGQRCPGAARKVSFRMQKSWYGWRWDTYPSVSTAATKIVDYRKPNLFKTGSWLRGDRRYTTGFNRIATPATAMSDEHAAWPLCAEMILKTTVSGMPTVGSVFYLPAQADKTRHLRPARTQFLGDRVTLDQ